LTVNVHEKESIKSEGYFCYRCGTDFSRFVTAMGRNQSSLQPPMDNIATKASKIDALLCLKNLGGNMKLWN
jgi:hypothetical protein